MRRSGRGDGQEVGSPGEKEARKQERLAGMKLPGYVLTPPYLAGLVREWMQHLAVRALFRREIKLWVPNTLQLYSWDNSQRPHSGYPEEDRCYSYTVLAAIHDAFCGPDRIPIWNWNGGWHGYCTGYLHTIRLIKGGRGRNEWRDALEIVHMDITTTFPDLQLARKPRHITKILHPLPGRSRPPSDAGCTDYGESIRALAEELAVKFPSTVATRAEKRNPPPGMMKIEVGLTEPGKPIAPYCWTLGAPDATHYHAGTDIATATAHIDYKDKEP